jgi:hypothetical protein
MKYYDFIEIQPPALYQDLIDRELIRDTETLHEIYPTWLWSFCITAVNNSPSSHAVPTNNPSRYSSNNERGIRGVR